MNRINKLFWFLNNPEYLFILVEIIKNKLFLNKESKKKSVELCKKHSIEYRIFKKKFLLKEREKKFKLNKLLNVKKNLQLIKLNREMVDKAQNHESKKVKISKKNFISQSGASNIDLLYDLIRNEKPLSVVETGVAYGWSSYAILLALKKNNKGKLISIDLPYPLMNEKKNIGIVVPKNLKKKWKILFCRDKKGIDIAAEKFNHKIDFFHYDSDKNYKPKLLNLKKIWSYMKHNGVLVCDDINDNLAFFDFTKELKRKYYVIKNGKKFLGIIRND